MSTRRERVLKRLQKAQGGAEGFVCMRSLTHPTVGGNRAAARLHELREAGIALERKFPCDCTEIARLFGTMTASGPAQFAPAGAVADSIGGAADVANRICSVRECGRPARSRSLCPRHYARWYRHGDPLGGGPSRKGWAVPAASRWQQHIAVTDSGCWEWTAARSSDGYGKTGFDGQALYAHRVVYEALVGPIPDGLQLDHLCRNRPCVNPDHLEPVTQAENVRRGLVDARTHCKHGHEFTDANTYRRPDTGTRQCRTCNRNRTVRRAAREKAARHALQAERRGDPPSRLTAWRLASVTAEDRQMELLG